MICCFPASPPSHLEVAVSDKTGWDLMGELRETCGSRGWSPEAVLPSHRAGEVPRGGDKAARNAHGFCKPTACLASCCLQLSLKLLSCSPAPQQHWGHF